jgi:hypothetical protein
MHQGEYYLRHDEVARRLGGMEIREVVDAIKEKEFGVRTESTTGPLKIGRFYYVTLTGFNDYVAARTVFAESGELKPVFARTPAELKHKVLRMGSS